MAYIGNNLTVQQYAPTIQYFSGNGSTTAFTLSIAVVTAAQIIVTVDNVIQNPSSAFTVSGTTLTFTSAPLTGTNNIWVEYTSLQTNLIQPGAGTVSYASLNSDNQSKLGITGKNRVINGAMVVAQRGTSTTSTAFINQVDQFQVATNAGTFTFGQSTNAPANFSNSAVVTNTASLTPSGTNYYSIRNVIEGLNVADLAWGSAYAKTVTLSFWVRSSVTGTFGGSVFNGSVNRSYPFTYAISSANTWEQKSITITGDTTGTWATDNTAGIYIEWALGTGSTYQGTAGAWAATRYQGATGQTQWSTTNGATFYLTGVQLEVGTQATQFTNAGGLYGGELALCQRYFEHNYGAGYAIGSAASYPYNQGSLFQGFNTASGQRHVSGYFAVTKRTTPSVVFYDAAGNSGKLTSLDAGGTGTNNVAIGYTPINLDSCACGNGSVTWWGAQMFWTASAEL